MAVYCDPKTNKQVGIRCDFCGGISRDKFKYYSAKIDLVEVDKNAGRSGILDIDRRFLDLDFCEACMKELKEKMLAVINNVGRKEQWTTKT